MFTGGIELDFRLVSSCMRIVNDDTTIFPIFDMVSRQFEWDKKALKLKTPDGKSKAFYVSICGLVAQRMFLSADEAPINTINITVIPCGVGALAEVGRILNNLPVNHKCTLRVYVRFIVMVTRTVSSVERRVGRCSHQPIPVRQPVPQ